jgi:oligopeptide transport system substrate-binding protein
LAEAGYPGGIGPDGKRLKLTYEVGQGGPPAVQAAQVYVHELASIGIEVETETSTWSEFLNKAHDGRLQFFALGWILDYPDPENFLQLLYGPNRPPNPNNTRYDNPEYNALFEQMKSMEDTPERLAIIHRMRDIVVEDAVWTPRFHSVDFILQHQWVKNYKPHGITGGYLKYRDEDVALRERLRKEWNRPNYGLLAVVAGALVLAGVGLALFRRRLPEGRT